MIVALARKLVIALWHYWRTTGGRRLTSSVLKGLGTSIPLSTIFGARAGFQHDCRTDDPRWREAVFEPGTDADRENGPAARSFAADAHDCIMVRIKRSYRIQVCGARSAPNGELPSDPPQTVNRQTPELCKKPLSLFIIAPRALGSRRCETQVPLGGKPPRSLDPLRALREPDR